MQIRTMNKSATAKLARNKFVGPFNCLEVVIDTMINTLPTNEILNCGHHFIIKEGDEK